MAISSSQDFHTAIHNSVGTPQPGVRMIHHHKNRVRRTYDRVHTSKWATSRVNLKSKVINIDIYIDFQRNSLSTADYTRLKNLAIKGIEQYWSRKINLSGQQFSVIVNVQHRRTESIDVDLYIETSSSYARSHNSGIIDASFKYNQGFYKGFPGQADKDFMLVSAHEFGHSVLEFFGGTGLSWRHKGSTTLLTQSTKSSTPGYPSKGEIDLMRYYDSSKNKKPVSSAMIYSRTIADEIDVKRLIWMSHTTIKK